MDHSIWMPHGFCFGWDPVVLAIHITGNAGIALAYFGIPIVLLIGIRRRPDFIPRAFGLLFALFIVACGIGHLVNIWTLWYPNYRFAAIWDVITAAISIATLYALLGVPGLTQRLLNAEQHAQLQAESVARLRRIEELIRHG